MSSVWKRSHCMLFVCISLMSTQFYFVDVSFHSTARSAAQWPIVPFLVAKFEKLHFIFPFSLWTLNFIIGHMLAILSKYLHWKCSSSRALWSKITIYLSGLRVCDNKGKRNVSYSFVKYMTFWNSKKDYAFTLHNSK